MNFEIIYTESFRSDGMNKFFWNYTTKSIVVSRAVNELMKAFYKWANKQKKGVLPLQITFLDWV